MSALDGKLVVSLNGTSYTLSTPPHAAAPFAQNQAFATALAAAVTSNTSPTPVVTTSTSSTLNTANRKLFVEFKGSTAAQTLTLPAASTAAGVEYQITNLASVTVSVTSAGGNILAIGVAAGLTRVLTAYTAGANLTSVTLVSDGTQWVIVDSNGGTFT